MSCYAIYTSDGEIPIHSGYEDVRTAYEQAQKIGREHPRETPESVYVVKEGAEDER